MSESRPRSLTEQLSADELALIVSLNLSPQDHSLLNERLPARDEPIRTLSVDHAERVSSYEGEGACALIVNIQEPLSTHSISLLRSVRDVSGRLPLMARTDIAVDGQVNSWRSAGVDALLIENLENANEEQLQSVIEQAHQCEMELAIVVRSQEELQRALALDIDVLVIDHCGLDNRFDVERTFDLLADVPVGWPVIIEAITDGEQVAQLHRAGVDAIVLDEVQLVSP